MAEPVIVTLDGPAGVGKITLAKMLAERLGMAYLDTGAMFRAAAFLLGDGSWTWPEERLAARLGAMSFSLRGAGHDSRLWVGQSPLLDKDIRTETVGMWASNLATLPVVRASLKKAQQDLARSTSLVAEGRDMGTVVFPKARHKFFLDADPDERARRRFLQLQALGKPADLGELARQIEARDRQDRTRTEAPLRPARDAVIIDTTRLTLEQVFERLLDGVAGKG